MGTSFVMPMAYVPSSFVVTDLPPTVTTAPITPSFPTASMIRPVCLGPVKDVSAAVSACASLPPASTPGSPGSLPLLLLHATAAAMASGCDDHGRRRGRDGDGKFTDAHAKKVSRCTCGALNAATGLLVALAITACNRGPSVPPTSALPAPGAGARDAGGSPAAKHQPFVVAIVVDQLSAWVAQSRWPELPNEGGFARLRREGTWVKTVRYPYAVTDTAPGHTSLHTGKLPAESGIFGNEVPEPNGQRVSILRDESVKPIAWDGPRSVPGSSAARLHVDTVADRLRAANPKALVVSVSVKDRGAILPAGKHPTHVLWFDSSLDSFVTSTAFASAFPPWAQGIGDAKSVALARTKPWELADPAWVKAHAAGPDNQAGEGDLEGLGITFPHVARTPAGFRALPAGTRPS